MISPEVVEVGDLDEGPIMEAADFPAGTRLLQCSRCNAIRTPEDGHPCPHCSNPEYGLITANGTGTPTEGWPDDEPGPGRSGRTTVDPWPEGTVVLGTVVRIDHDKLELVPVPAAPRKKKKEAPVARP